ncbi:RNA polymerase III subunit C82 [Maudiozyma exigua]|uniref:DNA-directed RNA polymerase III subunit RPC3 n=1 Tax=Maudiozyma exigua TaxID=34358 RepID=A0A9P6W3X1_MAUEX|nr:RNA polymerase III subunit C82 [Kazachstania exigua]
MDGLEIPNLPSENKEGNALNPSEEEVDEDYANAVSSLEQRMENPEKFLYTELIRANLGERAAVIIDLLISLGRLSIREMHNILNKDLDTYSSSGQTEWSIKDIKSAIVPLIQLRCLKYFEEKPYSGRNTTYYYYNTDGPLLMLYSGLIVEEMNNSFPADLEENEISAAQVIQNVLTVGSISLADFSENLSDESKSSLYAVSDIFVKLCDQGYLVPISKLTYTPLTDFWNVLYEKHYNAIPRTSVLSDLRKRAEAKGRAKEEFLNTIKKHTDSSKVVTTDPVTSLRTVHKNVPLTFNIDRFLKSRRSKHLVQLSKFRIGQVSAQVYRAALKLTEKKSVDLIHPLTQTGLLQDYDENNSIREEVKLMEQNSASFNAIELSKHLPSNLQLEGSLVTQKREIGGKKRQKEDGDDSASKKKLKTKDGFVIPSLPSHISGSINGAVDNEGEDDEMDLDEEKDTSNSVNLVNMHLKLLASSSIPFLEETRPGVYHVPYTKLMPIVRSSLYDYIIASTLGQSAMRIRRCIIANRLVSEKVINSMALMKEKDIRSTIASLIKFNVAEIQEVPRTMDRSAARAVFLFRSKEKHSYNFMKQNLGWNLANLIHKKEKLKEENATLLTKANREDVKGNEANLLLSSELNQLKMVNERELTTFTRLTRVISLWEIFRFYV